MIISAGQKSGPTLLLNPVIKDRDHHQTFSHYWARPCVLPLEFCFPSCLPLSLALGFSAVLFFTSFLSISVSMLLGIFCSSSCSGWLCALCESPTACKQAKTDACFKIPLHISVITISVSWSNSVYQSSFPFSLIRITAATRKSCQVTSTRQHTRGIKCTWSLSQSTQCAAVIPCIGSSLHTFVR
jgi:hypothetical protein